MQKPSSIVAAAVVAALLGVAPAAAQSGPEYFNGKTVNFVVATEPGGGYDTYGRLVAEHMQKHLPGSLFVVRNMPGAGHLIGANFINASAPDGLTIGTFNTGLVYNQLTGNPGVQFDLGTMSWVGKVASEPRVFVFSVDSGVETWDDIVNAEPGELRLGVAGVGAAAYIESTMLVTALDLPLEIISGLDGSQEMLAIMRGEVHGTLGSRSSWHSFVEDGNGRYVVQIGGSQTDVPQLSDLIPADSPGQSAVALVQSQGSVARLVAGPPNIPDDILGTLRDAFEAAVTDPEFLAKAEALNIPVDPLVGDDVHEAILRALDQPPELVEFLNQVLQ